MKFGEMLGNIKNFADRSGCQIKAHSPEILVVLGIGGVITAGIWACKATLKAHEVKERMQKSLEEIHNVENDKLFEKVYSKEDAIKDKARTFAKAGIEYTGLYAGPVIVGCLSLLAILRSEKILSDRLSGAIAFGNGAVSGVLAYREKVAEKIGKEEEELLYNNVKVTKNTYIDDSERDQDGIGKVKEEEKKSIKLADVGRRVYIIDRSCKVWDRNPDLTDVALNHALTYLNNLLVKRYDLKRNKPGYLFLWEALECIGVPREEWPEEASIAGWLYFGGDDKLNKIDFGPLYRLVGYEVDEEEYWITDENRDDYVISVEPNVDGIIFDKI